MIMSHDVTAMTPSVQINYDTRFEWHRTLHRRICRPSHNDDVYGRGVIELRHTVRCGYNDGVIMFHFIYFDRNLLWKSEGPHTALAMTSSWPRRRSANANGCGPRIINTAVILTQDEQATG